MQEIEVQLINPITFVVDVARLGLTLDDFAPLASVRPYVLKDFAAGTRRISLACQRQITFALYAVETLADVGVDVQAVDLVKPVAGFNAQRSREELEDAFAGMELADELDPESRTAITPPVEARP